MSCDWTAIERRRFDQDICSEDGSSEMNLFCASQFHLIQIENYNLRDHKRNIEFNIYLKWTIILCVWYCQRTSSQTYIDVHYQTLIKLNLFIYIGQKYNQMDKTKIDDPCKGLTHSYYSSNSCQESERLKCQVRCCGLNPFVKIHVHSISVIPVVKSCFFNLISMDKW